MEEDDNKKDYEMAFLLGEEADLKGLLGILRQHEAEISFEGPVRKIALAYEIEKQTSAFFGFVRFTAPPAQIPELDKVLVLNKSVLRSLVVRYTPGQAPAVSQISGVATDIATPVSAEPIMPAESPVMSGAHSLPLSNEDLEKKIEEILK